MGHKKEVVGLENIQGSKADKADLQGKYGSLQEARPIVEYISFSPLLSIYLVPTMGRLCFYLFFRGEDAPEIGTKIWDLLSSGDGTPEIPPRVGLRGQTQFLTVGS